VVGEVIVITGSIAQRIKGLMERLNGVNNPERYLWSDESALCFVAQHSLQHLL
jgi:hypothetical protein